jgi:D,D-heptose 1,7-bisphosphate phosphatase
MNHKYTKAIFLDRDGTINADANGYINDPNDFQLFDFSIEAIRIFNEMGFKVIIVTNQSGIARGIITLEQLDRVHNYMADVLAKGKAYIDLILYSPYFSKGQIEPYNIDHHSRKPAPGMFFEALQHYPIKAKDSYMIGDKAEDIEFGKSNGLITILVKTGNGENQWTNERHKFKVMPDFVVENLLSAAKLIKVLASL